MCTISLRRARAAAARDVCLVAIRLGFGVGAAGLVWDAPVSGPVVGRLC